MAEFTTRLLRYITYIQKAGGPRAHIKDVKTSPPATPPTSPPPQPSRVMAVPPPDSPTSSPPPSHQIPEQQLSRCGVTAVKLATLRILYQVVEEISRSTSESLKDAREIIERIMTRKLYWCVGEAKLKQNQKKISEEEKESLKTKLNDDASNFKDNFEVKTITMDYGMKNTDPISKTYFYKKTKPDRAFKIPKAKVSMLLPEYFSETILRVYWKNPEDGGKEKKKESFNQWCKENNYEVYEEEDEATAGTDQ
ncbi:deoxynucleoside triphosphate triphosphohydrolase SAMHD1-like [Archocentrus centrarchus]|uniref:deoxynucleoside triphosphate triphosphohydrolase SAMHD1-like n=1 Tax=Archocentrus centrarchus TaxID=63155 RepID=UPI0011E9E5E4|nr:deoxynucleoside triphosphate triphosphohydrolase SAMHD1-like [Archocentrus centrarchus]